MRLRLPLVLLALAPAAATAAQPRYTTVARTGQGMPVLLSYRFSQAVINDAGVVAADVEYDRENSIKHALTLFPAPGTYDVVARQNTVAPGATDAATFGPVFDVFALNRNGQLAFRGYIGSNVNTQETLFATPDPRSGSPIAMHLIAREGFQAAGVPAGTNYKLGPMANYAFFPMALGDGGHIAYTGGLSDNTRALWSGTPAQPLLVARTGDPAPSTSYTLSFTSSQVPRPTVNPAGQVAFRAGVVSGANTFQSGIALVATPAANNAFTLRKLAARGDPAPDTAYPFASFGDVSINPAGKVAFDATLDAVTHGARAIYTDAPGPLTLVARYTADAPGTGTAYGTTFSSALLSANNAVTFSATLADGTSALFSGPAGGVRPVARQGQPAPGTTTTYGSFNPNASRFTANSHGQVAFTVPLTSGGTALFATDRAGQTLLVTRNVAGGTFDPGNGAKPISGYTVVLGSNSDDGLPSAFNDRGQLAFSLSFNSGPPTESAALVVATVPFPADATGDGLVDTADFRRLFSHFGQPGTQADGDFNYDGQITFADFQLLERWFGKSVDDAPVLVSAGDRAALDAFAQTVPEPGTFLLALSTTLILRRRRPS